MKILNGFAAFALMGAASIANATCEQNVDNIETYYINGMFTDYSDFISNRDAIDRFIQENLGDQGFTNPVGGTHNDSEPVLTQALEVLRQKVEDGETSEAIMEFINGDDGYLDALTDRQQVEAFLGDINDYYTLGDDVDQQAANADVRALLDTCSRVIVITHSQGNFYGNRVLSSLYSGYSFPNGYSLSQYPMLGTLQIASPVDIPGGAISAIYPEIIGHLTNDNDLVMDLVRGTIGSTDSNYASEDNPNDWTGHGLEDSYLNQSGQGAEISSQLSGIASSLTPYPMHGQQSVGSSALSGYGHSSINSILDIQFRDGSVYRYSGVSAGTAAGLGSGAAGSHFNSSIRDQYSYEQIE
jgi:hypothetical protein